MRDEIEAARKLTLAHKSQATEIANYVGVHRNWVLRFATGQVGEPGAIKFAKLQEWLSENT